MLTLHWGGLKGVIWGEPRLSWFSFEIGLQRCPPPLEVFFSPIIMKRLQEAPTFSQLDAEAISQAVDCGVAKISNFVGEATLALLQKRFGIGDDAELDSQVVRILPELAPVYEQLYTEANIANGMAMKVSVVALGASVSKGSHQDTVAPKGLSLLIPYIGPEALFAASSLPFKLSWQTFEPKPMNAFAPEYLTTYGPGDAVLLRQAIDNCDGQPRDLEKTHHAGLADDRRKLLILDFITMNLVTQASVA